MLIAALTVIGCGSSRDDSLFTSTSGGTTSSGGSIASGGSTSFAGVGSSTSSGGSISSGGTAASTGGASNGGTLQNDASLSGGAGGALRIDSGSSADGGPFSPGMVLCAGVACDVVTQPYPSICCVNNPAVWPYYPTVCMPALTGCVYGGVVLTCDDASDCAPGLKCCLESAGSVCAGTCTSNQLCRVSAECGSGTCIPFAYAPEYSICQ